MALPKWEQIAFSRKGPLMALYDMIKQVAAGYMEAGSVQTDDVANGAITEPKLATGAVTSGKMADGSASAAKLRGDIKSYESAGITIEALTSAIADPATLPESFTARVIDSSDSDAIYLVNVKEGAFYLSAEFTAAVASGG